MTGTHGETAPGPIRSERVELRELDARQAAAIAAGEALADQQWAPGYPLDGTLVAARMLVRLTDAGGYRPGFGMYQIIDRASGRVVGDVGFHAAPDETGSVEIGYGLAPAFRGAGLMTEAVRALTAWAFAGGGVREVRAETEADHAASRGVLLRAGFQEAGADAENRYYALPNPAVSGS